MMQSQSEEDRLLALRMINTKSLKLFNIDDLYNTLKEHGQELDAEELIRIKGVFRKKKYPFKLIDFIYDNRQY